MAVVVEAGGGVVTKDRVPLRDIVTESMQKRLQDAGYHIVHTADMPVMRKEPKKTRRAKTAKKTAKKKTAKKAAKKARR
jgi:hypothetical protein